MHSNKVVVRKIHASGYSYARSRPDLRQAAGLDDSGGNFRAVAGGVSPRVPFDGDITEPGHQTDKVEERFIVDL